MDCVTDRQLKYPGLDSICIHNLHLLWMRCIYLKLILLNNSFLRRSVRSSYAFSHQEGFGRLITSGKLVRIGSGANSQVKIDLSFETFHVLHNWNCVLLQSFFQQSNIESQSNSQMGPGTIYEEPENETLPDLVQPAYKGNGGLKESM